MFGGVVLGAVEVRSRATRMGRRVVVRTVRDSMLLSVVGSRRRRNSPSCGGIVMVCYLGIISNGSAWHYERWEVAIYQGGHGYY